MPKVSVIIPFNNVETYIKECLDSVINQTLKDIEIILVNDASSDKSREIAQEYLEKDSRIKIIDLKERHGQGYARNRAMEIAQGEYIGFVDSDDFIEPNMFYELYNKAVENDCDLVLCQAREFDDINQKYLLSDYYSLRELESVSDKVFSSEDVKNELLDINVCLWNKIYKREYLEKIGEKLPEGYIYEDLPFFYATFLPANRIQVIWKSLYIYRTNRKNSTMQQFNKKILDRLYMVSLTYEKLKQFDFLSDISDKIKGWVIDDLFHRYSMLQENYQKEYFFLMKKIFQNLDIIDSDNPKWKKVYYFEGYKLVVNNNFEDFTQKVFNIYTNIHIVEDKILSKVYDRLETDNIINGIYSEINKNYDYVSNNIEKNSKFLINNFNNELKSSVNDSEQRIKESFSYLKKELTAQIDDKVSKIYEYTNSLSEEIKTKLNNDTEVIKANVTQETDDKISKVYEEVSKNYDYTNALNEELKERLVRSDSRNSEAIEGVKNELTQSTDDKIGKVYEEISKIYEYTNQLSEKLKTAEANISDSKNEIQNQQVHVSDELNNVYEEISFNQDKILEILKLNLQNTKNYLEDKLQKNIDNVGIILNEKTDNLYSKINNSAEELYNKTTDDYKSLTNIIEAKVDLIKNKTELENKNLSDDIYKEMDNIKNNFKNESDNNIKKLNKEINSNKEEMMAILDDRIKEIEQDFEKKLSIQKIDYENQIKELNSQIEYLSKNPIRRYIDKIGKKNA